MGTLTSGRICTPTLFCLVAPPCTPVLLTACKRKSLPWLLPSSRSRSLLPLKGNTLFGSEAPFWLHCPPFNKCGFQSKNTTNLVLALCTGNASKFTAAPMLLLYVMLSPPNCGFFYYDHCWLLLNTT